MIGLYLLRTPGSGNSGNESSSNNGNNPSQAASVPPTTFGIANGPLTNMSQLPFSTASGLDNQNATPSPASSTIPATIAPLYSNNLPILTTPVSGYQYSVIDQCCSQHGVPQAPLPTTVATTGAPTVATSAAAPVSPEQMSSVPNHAVISTTSAAVSVRLVMLSCLSLLAVLVQLSIQQWIIAFLDTFSRS